MAYVGHQGKRNWLNDYNQHLGDWLPRPPEAEVRGSNPSDAPIAVGLILGEMVETNFQNSLKMFEGNWWQILTQPLAALFLLLAFFGLFSAPIAKWFTSRRS